MAYTGHTWQIGEPITKNKMDHIEEGIASLDNAISGQQIILTQNTASIRELQVITNQLDPSKLNSAAREVELSHSSSLLQTTYLTLADHLEALDAASQQLTLSKGDYSTFSDYIHNVYETAHSATLTAANAKASADLANTSINNALSGTGFNTLDERLDSIDTAINTITDTTIGAALTARIGDLETYSNVVNYIDGRIGTEHTVTAKDYTDSAISTAIGNIGQSGNVQNYVNTQVQSAKDYTDNKITSITASISEIDAAHRQEGDTLDNRFDDIEAAISHAASGNDAGGLTEQIGALNTAIGTINTNINTATINNIGHTYSDLNARFADIDSTLNNLANSTATTVISPAAFEVLITGDPDVDYLVGPDNDNKYYYYKWINDGIGSSWKLISGGGGSGTGNSSAEVVTELPTEDIDENTDYYLSINNGYRHYRYIDNDWVLITPEVAADVNTKLTNYNTRIGSLETALAQQANRVTNITAHTAKDYTFNYLINDDSSNPQEVTLKAPNTITDIELSQDQTKLTITDSAGDTKEINLPQGGGGGTSGGTLAINRIGSNSLQVLSDTACNLQFTITAAEASGAPLTGAAAAQWYVNGELKDTTTVTADFISGETQTEANRMVNTYNIAPYLATGVNTVRLRITKNTGGDSDSATSTSWTVNVINFSLTWNYDESTIQDGEKIQFRWTPYGTGIEKTTHIYIDEGTENEKHYTSVTSSNGIAQILEVNNDLSHGTHLVKMYLTGTINGRPETSLPVMHALLVVDPTSSLPIVSTSAVAITMTQYDTEAIPLVIYNPIKLETNASLYVDDVLVDTWENINRNTQYWYYTPNLEGTHYLRVTSDSASVLITVTVEPLNLEGVEEISGYDLKLKASDFASNNALQNWCYDDEDPINTALQFSSDFDWTNGGIKTELDENRNVRQYICVKAGSTMTIPYQLFANDIKATGADVKIVFKVTNCSNYDASIVNCITSQEVLNTETNKMETQYTGFQMNAHNALLGGTTKYISTQYGEDEYTELEFEVYQKNASAADYMMLWVDGVMSSARAYTDAESFVQSSPENIVIGSPYCDIYIYLIKIYRIFLDRENHLANFIADAPNATEIALRYNRNDILDELNEISPEKLAEKNPNCRVWKYDIPRMTHAKDDKVSGCGFEQIFKGGTEDDQLRGVGTIAVQGTSSVNYRYGAANTDIDFSNGELYTVTRSGSTTTNVKNLLEEETPGFKLSPNAIPITYANMKVNFASCEQVNNMCNAEWYDRFQPYPSLSARDCMEFHPGVQFIRDAHASGEQINLFEEKENYDPNKFYMYSIGNLGNSKKNTAVFHSAKECCIEIKENTSDAQRMITYDSEWTQEGHDSNYEMRYPKLNKTTQAMRDGWERFVTWMVASNPNGATNEALDHSVTFQPYTFRGHNRQIINKEGHHYEQVLRGLTIDRYANIEYTHDTFDYRMAKMLSECEDYMAMDSIIYHFCFIERHTMVDNVAKNTFWSATETNQLINGEEQEDTAGYWIWDLSKNYDNDTSDGNNNNGLLVFDYGNEANDTYREGTTAVFNGNNSVWFVFANNLYEACQRMFINRETYGAWDSKIYHAYLTSEQRKIPERVWNECYWYDYLRTYESTSSNMQKTWINFLDGGQKIHQRSHFETYQEIYMSSKYLSPFSRNQSITIRGEDVENSELPSAKTEFTLTMFNKCYLTIHIGTNEKTVKCQKNVPVTIAFYKDEAHPEQGYMSLSNSVIDIDTGSMVRDIGDLSLLYPSSCQFGSAIRLRSLTIGSNTISGYYNPNMTSASEITLDNPILEELIVQNLPYANYTLNLSKCPELKTLNAGGSSFTGYVFANGGKLTNAVLERPAAIVLRNLNLLTNSNLVINNYTALTSLQIENCKLLNELTILNAATNLQTLRFVGLKWYDENKLLTNEPLERMIAMNGLDYNGFAIDQSYVSGRIDLDPPTRIRKSYIMAYREAWEPDLTLNIADEDILPQYKISFYDEDGTTHLSQYDYYIDPFADLYDPVYGSVSNNIEPKNAPSKSMTADKIYTFGQIRNNAYVEFSGWQLFNGTKMNSNPVTNDTNYKAVYTSSPRQYTVDWYSGETKVDTQSIDYGAEAVTSIIPSNSYVSATGVARTFKGWDKSTGYITSNLVVNALFDEGTLPTREYLLGHGLKDLTPAQIYALGQIDNTTRTALLGGSDSLIKDYIEITMGNDYTFSNVISNSLISTDTFFSKNASSGVKVYDGTASLPNLRLLSEDDPFTIVIDYKFNMVNAATQSDALNQTKGILASCYEYADSQETGFKLFFGQDTSNNYHTMISWGSSSNAIATGGYANNKFYRDVVVLRKPKNSKNLYVYYTEPSETYGNSVTSAVLQNAADPYTTMPLILGGRYRYLVDYNTYEKLDLGNGVIYWSKLWHEDLGATVCTSLAQWSHEKIKFELEGFNDGGTGNNKIIPDRVDTGAAVNLTFLSSTLLGDRLYLLPGTSTYDTVEGWKTSDLRTYCNDRIYKGIPTPYRSIIKLSPIYSYGRAYDSYESTFIAVEDGNRYSSPGDYIVIPSYQETFTGDAGNNNAGRPFNNEALRTIPWIISPINNTAYQYSGQGSPTVMTSKPLNYQRIRFKGKEILPTATIFNYNRNPYGSEFRTVVPGDIWILTNSNTAFMYVSQEEIDNYGLEIMTSSEYECKDSNNQPDGGWISSDDWWTRSLVIAISHPYNLFYRVNKLGAAGQTYRDAPSTNKCALCLQFSV